MTDTELMTPELAARTLGVDEEELKQAVRALQIPSREGQIPHDCLPDIKAYLQKQKPGNL